MSKKIYEKVGKRYKELGIEFIGFPANGVWLVEDGHQSLIQKLADLDDIPPTTIAKFFKHRDRVTRELMEYVEGVKEKTKVETEHGTWCTSPSYNDMVTSIFLSLCRIEKENADESK